jgi:hypothetical protein
MQQAFLLIWTTRDLERATKEVGTKIDSLAPLVVDSVCNMLESCAADAGVVTRQGLEEMLRKTLDESMSKFQHASSGAVVNERPDHDSSAQRPVTQLHLWGSGLHHVPQSFELASGTTYHMWNFWFLGDGVHNYPPFRQLEPSDMPNNNGCKRLSDLKVNISF